MVACTKRSALVSLGTYTSLRNSRSDKAARRLLPEVLATCSRCDGIPQGYASAEEGSFYRGTSRQVQSGHIADFDL